MIPVVIEAALRSLLVGVIVAIGLRVFRVRNVVAQKAALGLVLVGALTMPFLVPITARLQVLPAKASIVLPARAMTLLEELQARLQAKSGSGGLLKPAAVSTPSANPPQADTSAEAALGPVPAQAVKGSGRSSAQSAPAQAEPVADNSRGNQEANSAPRASRVALSPSVAALSIYLAIVAVLLLRLVAGLAVTLRLWFTATPIPSPEMPGVRGRLSLRTSKRISSPLTIGSGILLPSDYESWDREKLRIVLAHERSHVRQGDFYLQLVAGLYATLVWFSPLGWWLKRELADLAEAISDRAGIEEARSRISYAQILLEFAAAPRPTALGVAMARSGSLARRIERLLNDHTFRQSFAGSRRALVAVVLVPLALFASTALVRVEAATQYARVAWIAPVTSPAPAPVFEPQTANLTEQLSEDNAEPESLAFDTGPDASANVAVAPESEAPAITPPEIAGAQLAPNLLPVPGVARAMAAQAESGNSLSFDRTLSASEGTQLLVTTGSGNIHLTRSSGSQIHIHGQIHVSHEGKEEQARQIAANPPIEQSGNVIKVGKEHEDHWRGISINYQIEAPAGTLLGASSGSGDIVDEGVGQNAKLETGSGDIRANGLQGALILETGSGNIIAEQIGQGDVKAETGSGNIEIKDVHGGFNAETGSGDIKASGTPSAPWKLETGSGNIEIWSGKAPLTLDASTGSGSVTTDSEMLVKGSLNHHHVTGSLNGGGPLLRAETGSGDIHVH
ncbi:MAG TPA: M56 family metallopeptidase [Terracidiphilus sp.]|jgi:beta-lactamase regulating signal transducer with metallopeptidase domain